ncbi:MAG TPA: DUF1571 domain-containing protein [Gemmataceae bacterium]|nr:DUF1571 domain-containing protein [Gemmataceae bacterium]
MSRIAAIVVVLGSVFCAGYWCWSINTPVAPETTDRPVEFTTVSRNKEAETTEEILRTDPMRFLRMSLERIDKEISGYSLTFEKREHPLKGKLLGWETIRVDYLRHPHSVRMKWKSGSWLADAVLYVEGQNDGKMFGIGAGPLRFAGLQTYDPEGDKAQASGRYFITSFGFERSTKRTLAAMEKAAAREALRVEYEGIVTVSKLGDTKCYKLVRHYDKVEEDDLGELDLYFDTEHWLQVGSQLKTPKGEDLGQYFFRDIVLNPTFDPKTFTKAGL